MWAIEKRKYKDDLTKICFTANLLERPTSSKHRDPVQWYEAYHAKIHLSAARRLPGGQRAVIDPIWSTWDIFVATLGSSFGTKVGKDQAVTQWLNLQHINSIDEYLDSLINLMWQTGYPEDVAKDNLVRGLKREVGLAWAQTPNKPRTLYEQMAMLRDIGHNLENFHHLQGENKHTGEKQEKKTKKHMRGGKEPQGTGTGKKRAREQASEWKDKDSELAGISTELLEERKKSDMCLKYGKRTYK